MDRSGVVQGRVGSGRVELDPYRLYPRNAGAQMGGYMGLTRPDPTLPDPAGEEAVAKLARRDPAAVPAALARLWAMPGAVTGADGLGGQA